MNEIIKTLEILINSGIEPTKVQNERYLHHYLSNILQKKHKIVYEKLFESRLHPEWPTYKEQTKLNYGRYKFIKDKKEYSILVNNGTAGFIDFAIGDYNKPEIGIELTSKFGWNNEEIIYDFMKLLDRRNPFKKVLSFNIIYRENMLVKGKNLINLENKIDQTIGIVKKRLGSYFNEDIEIFFWIVEISKKGSKKLNSWYWDDISKTSFQNSMPKL
jgi:hypothetical protein